MLTARNIRKAFWGIQALRGVSLEIRAGEVHAIVGENGAGKSTLMRILAGLERADAGEIGFRGRGISMIHQELLPFPDLSVEENIWMGHEPVGRFGRLDRAAMRAGALQWLERVGLTLDPARPMRGLSVAELQSVEIARALARDADLFIMDEPTAALSAREAEALFRLIGELTARGAAVVYISHHLDEIFRLASTITVLRDGGSVASGAAGEFDRHRLISLMVGREMELYSARAPVPPGEVVLEVRRLGRSGRFRDVSFELRRGEVLGLAGLMGAGRSEVAAAIYGLAPADAGEIVVKGRPVRIHSPAAAVKLGIAMVTEDRKEFGLVPAMSLAQNLTLTALARWCRGPVIRRRSEAAAAVAEMRRFNVRAAGPQVEARYLSGGNQQKVVIAKALLADPAVLILDEPTRGIDIGAKTEIYELIARLAGQGLAILLISSEMNEILQLSDRVLVMREGVAAAQLDPRRTTPEEVLQWAMPQ